MPAPTIRIVFPRVVTISTSGATDHGQLTGLADDDHAQYHNNARGDARYSPLGHQHTSLTAVDVTTFRLAMSGGRFLKITPVEEGSEVTIQFTVENA
jgi:hypothetical protein